MSNTQYADTWAVDYTGPINPSPNFDKFEDLIVLYNYIPNAGFNIFATIVWFLTLVAHSYRIRTKHTRVIQCLIAFGAFWEVIAYAVRAVNHYKIYRADLCFTQLVITQVAPFLFYGAIHNSLDNLLQAQLRSSQGKMASLPYLPRPKVWIYLLSAYNVAVCIITIIGGSLLGHGYARVATDMPQGSADYVLVGYAVLRTGLGNQLAMLTITQGLITWLIIAAFRGQRSSSKPSTKVLDLKLLLVLFLTTGMIWTRTIFRLAEGVEGVFGQAWSSEALFGVFEFATVWVAVTIWAVLPIGKPGEARENGSSKGSEV